MQRVRCAFEFSNFSIPQKLFSDALALCGENLGLANTSPIPPNSGAAHRLF